MLPVLDFPSPDMFLPGQQSRIRNNAVSVAFTFPGQGSQQVGMGKALADQFQSARDVFAEVDWGDILGLQTRASTGPKAILCTYMLKCPSDDNFRAARSDDYTTSNEQYRFHLLGVCVPSWTLGA